MPLVAAAALAALVQLAPTHPVSYSQLKAIDARLNGRGHTSRHGGRDRAPDPPKLRPALNLKDQPSPHS